MKHLIETENPSGLATVPYDRIVLDSTENDVIVKGGGATYEYVDLGLPSHLKWAKCNIGAEKETDYGYYFQWGSTKPNTAHECIWTNAPFNGGNTSYNADAFNQVKDTVCPNNVLAKEYDTASQIMGGEWRMPTNIEIQEMWQNTDKQWFDNYNGSGVNGGKFTSKTNGNSIFIPTSNFYANGSVVDFSNSGYFWSSSLSTSEPESAYMMFSASDNSGLNFLNRYVGVPVRGVFK